VQFDIRSRVQLDRTLILTTAFALSLLGSACARLAPEAGDSDAVSDKVPARIRAELNAHVDQDLIVLLAPAADDSDSDVQASGQALASDLDEIPFDDARDLADALVEERAELYAKLQSKVLAAVSDIDDLELAQQYTNLPFLVMHVKTGEGLEALAAQPEVARIYENTRFEHALAQSLPQINQPAAAAAGKLGANTAVAVLDTGCDYTRSAFGTCSSPGSAGCKVAYAADFATNDNNLDDNGHGTNVSGIVLGVAPSTKILALDVFAGQYAPGSAILAAIDWSISHRTTYNIVAMNMSLGSGNNSAPCTNDYFATAVANARAAGILAAIASGNNGYTSSISSPACVPAAISVGAVYDAAFGGISYSGCSDSTTAMDKVTCFSNSASFVSVLAPGAAITAANITMTGTSQASPHVAGALAVLRSAFPSEALNATVARVTDTGPQITDPRNGVVKHRLDLNAALGLAGGGGGGGGGVTLPTGSVTIQGGAAAVKTGTVTLAITASDGVKTMCVSNTASCSSFIAFAPTKTWALATGDGTKTVYVSLKDAAGNVTKVSDTIVRDAKAPLNPVLTATAGNTKIDLSWTEGSDAASGVASYKVVFATGASAPSSCNTGMVLYTGTSRTASHTGLVNGLQYSYRVCAIDAASNLSTGATASARPAPELEPPTGTVVISSGAQFAKSTSVTLTLSATDASGVTSMCISNTTKCTSWVAYTTTKTWTLSTNSTVYVWFRDAWGNVSTSPATDTIVVDKTVPTMGSFFQALAGAGRVELAWSAATDAASGVGSYKLVWAKSTTAPSCTTGMTAYSGSATAYTHSNLTAGKYSYRLCALDTAGNMSTGLTRTVTVQ
jgi:Subtilase family